MDIIERRCAPRYPVNLAASIKVVSGSVFDARVHNISLSGLQLTVSMAVMPFVLPNQERDNKMIPVSVEIQIQLSEPLGDVRIHCGIAYVNRHSQDSLTLGVEYRDFLEDGARKLSDFIYQCSSESQLNIQQEFKQQQSDS